MTTSKLSPRSQFDELHQQAIPPDLPSEAQLTQWANQLFQNLPCDGSRIAALNNALPIDVTRQTQNAFDPALVELALPTSSDLAKKIPIDATNPTTRGNYYFLEVAESHARSLKTRDLGALRGASNAPGNQEPALLNNATTQAFNDNPAIDYQKLNAPRFDISHIPQSAASSGLPSTTLTYPEPLFAEQTPQDLPKTAPVDVISSIEATPDYTTDATKTQVKNLATLNVDSSLLAALHTSPWLKENHDAANAIDWLRLTKPSMERQSMPLAATPTQSGFYFLDNHPEASAIESARVKNGYRTFDVNAVRRDFPILNERINGHQLVWLDNAATTQKPTAVIERLSYFYQHENSNIHRAAHTLAARATDAYEQARRTVAQFIHAASSDEIVFVRGTTEAINLVAQSWGRDNVSADDEIVITWLEHHANIVPWQQLCALTGAKLRIAPVDDQGQIIFAEYQKLLSNKTKLVAFTHVSNALGTITPAAEMIAAAQRVGARVLLDAAQSVSHIPIDVQALGCDWLVFSGHKVFAPTGIGVLYGKPELLAVMPPWQGGGNMIEDVTFEHTIYQQPPARFEAGTGNIADAIGLGAALEYVNCLGISTIAHYEHELLIYAMDALQRIPGLTLIGTAKEKTSVLSFILAGYSTEEVGTALNQAGIAVRSGHHCAQPILRRFGLESTVRPSLAFYNTYEEIDYLVTTIRKIKRGKV